MSGYKCMKYILLVFNLIMMILGGTAVGLGVWALVSSYGANEVRHLTGNELYEAACIAVISGGGLIFLTSFIGCCGAWTESRCMLGCYFFIMLVFLLMFVATAGAIFYFKTDLENELTDAMTHTLLTDYGVGDQGDLTQVWDKVQRELNCCGVKGNRSSSGSWHLWQSSKWYRMQEENTNPHSIQLVPSSCCDGRQTHNLCQLASTEDVSYGMAPGQSGMDVTRDNPALYEDGCIDKLKDNINEYLMAIGVIAVVIFVVMLFSVIFSVCVCTHVSRAQARLV